MRRYSLFLIILSVMIIVGAVIVNAQQPPTPTTLFEAFILDVRTDMELLADEVFGEAERPETWTANFDLQSTNSVPDLWFDNEQLADEIFGSQERPETWFGVTSANAELLGRNVRHDLELSAENIFGGIRPDDWTGAPRRFTCNQTIQNILRMLDVEYDTRPSTPEVVADYCATVSSELESELLLVVFEGDAFGGQLPFLALALRGDLERLRDEVLGVNVLPPQWTDNREEGSPTLIADVAADLERLADIVLGSQTRPEEWSGFINGSASLSYRNLRFSLEILADIAIGDTTRPRGWQGEDPTEQCDVFTQGLYFIVTQVYAYDVSEEMLELADICPTLKSQVNFIAENPPAPEEIAGELIDENTRYLGEAQYAFAYLDVSALQYMGAMPSGTIFRAWYRNFNESSMMFVSGEDFAVFIDRRWTTMEEEVFNTLPTLDGILPLTFCDANWCNGPGPTPTPTGGGPLALLVYSTTPQPTLDASTIGETGKTQVSWNHVRVTYLLDNDVAGTVQVTIEICATPAQIACEPVISVFDNSTGTFKPIISQYNGLSVYEFRYGYNTSVVIESESFVSPDIWISDPTIR